MQGLNELIQRVAEELVRSGRMLAVAESCTGGWVSKSLTDLAGSSNWFERGFVTYSNVSKQEMLAVPAAILEQHGAVSEATVLAMVNGVLAHSRADVALAISGIAGPGGAVPGKPVGTVCFAWALQPDCRLVETRRYDGDRAAVRRQAVIHAVSRLLQILQDG